MSVGRADDRLELEADRTATRAISVIRRESSAAPADSDGEVAPPPAPLAVAGGIPAGRGSRIQAKRDNDGVGFEGGPVDADTDRAIRAARGRGAPLDDTVRRTMEAGLGTDLSEVRIHADRGAADLSNRIQAKAFTTGSDVFFSRGAYAPSTPGGQHLLAHELAHVVQQRGGDTGGPLRRGWGGKKDKKAGTNAPKPVIGGPTDVSINGMDPQAFRDDKGYSPDQVIDVSSGAREERERQEKERLKAEAEAAGLESWRNVWGTIDQDITPEAKLDALLVNFKANLMGFSYGKAAPNFARVGDCGSLSRTFQIIAERALHVDGVKVKYHNEGMPGWYLPPGLREIGVRPPNVADGGHWFLNHVWCEWDGKVYDVLFGEKAQHGRKPDGFKNVKSDGGETVLHFRVGNDWFRREGKQDKFVAAAAPE
jgi:hypothetical protein